MRKSLAGLLLLAGLGVAVPRPAFANSATDAALGLGAFAVFNQILSGTGLFGAATPYRQVVVAPPPAVVQQPPVIYTPAPSVVYTPAPPVVYAPPPAVIYSPAYVRYGVHSGPRYYGGRYRHPRHHDED